MFSNLVLTALALCSVAVNAAVIPSVNDYAVVKRYNSRLSAPIYRREPSFAVVESVEVHRRSLNDTDGWPDDAQYVDNSAFHHNQTTHHRHNGTHHNHYTEGDGPDDGPIHTLNSTVHIQSPLNGNSTLHVFNATSINNGTVGTHNGSLNTNATNTASPNHQATPSLKRGIASSDGPDGGLFKRAPNHGNPLLVSPTEGSLPKRAPNHGQPTLLSSIDVSNGSLHKRAPAHGNPTVGSTVDVSDDGVFERAPGRHRLDLHW